VWMIHFWMVENHYPDKVMQQFNLFQQVPPPTLINYQQVLTYHKNKHSRKAVKGRMSIRHSITGGHGTSLSCLSRSHDHTTMPSTICIWDDIIREGWLQYGTE
jgi:hypothetical protein